MTSLPHEETIYFSNMSISRANYDYPLQETVIAWEIPFLAEIIKELKMQILWQYDSTDMTVLSRGVKTNETKKYGNKTICLFANRQRAKKQNVTGGNLMAGGISCHKSYYYLEVLKLRESGSNSRKCWQKKPQSSGGVSNWGEILFRRLWRRWFFWLACHSRSLFYLQVACHNNSLMVRRVSHRSKEIYVATRRNYVIDSRKWTVLLSLIHIWRCRR